MGRKDKVEDMFVKQIDISEAFKLAAKGQEIKVLVSPAPGEGWSGLMPDTLQDMLEGCLFFQDEPAMVESGFEEAVQEMEAPNAVEAGETKKPAGKRRPVDTGKIMALHKAGWSNVKIADELGISDMTVGNHLRKLREEQNAED